MILALTTAKVLASLTYFNSFFVIGEINGDMTVMGNYGDSSLYHQRAVDIASLLSLQIDSLLGKLYVCLAYEGLHGNIQMLNAVSGAQWGYPLFLGVVYLVVGNNPLVGIVANTLLMFFYYRCVCQTFRRLPSALGPSARSRVVATLVARPLGLVIPSIQGRLIVFPCIAHAALYYSHPALPDTGGVGRVPDLPLPHFTSEVLLCSPFGRGDYPWQIVHPRS
jgi:hypothetical protein